MLRWTLGSTEPLAATTTPSRAQRRSGQGLMTPALLWDGGIGIVAFWKLWLGMST